jgi:hypothetical protein
VSGREARGVADGRDRGFRVVARPVHVPTMATTGPRISTLLRRATTNETASRLARLASRRQRRRNSLASAARQNKTHPMSMFVLMVRRRGRLPAAVGVARAR